MNENSCINFQRVADPYYGQPRNIICYLRWGMFHSTIEMGRDFGLTVDAVCHRYQPHELKYWHGNV